MPVDDSYTKVLLHFDGSFLDESGKIWNVASGAQILSLQAKFGLTSGYFPSGCILTPDHADFYLADGDFTIDCWLYLTTLVSGGDDYQIIYSQLNSDSDRFGIGYHASGYWRLIIDSTVIAFADTPPTNEWFHFALTRTGSSWKIYRAGTQVGGTQTSSATIDNIPAGVLLGSYNGSVLSLRGYMDEFRLSKGIVRWASDFTPPIHEYGQYRNYLIARRDRYRTTGISLG